ncbi:hypothetical protein [Kitasatospora arboriphila]|uniref:ATP-grasp-modified RiPP n=1 Tax=Kitasatospora arboriphila TaxID=258052 RepID=A0ABN1TXB0_9ACTN
MTVPFDGRPPNTPPQALPPNRTPLADLAALGPHALIAPLERILPDIDHDRGIVSAFNSGGGGDEEWSRRNKGGGESGDSDTGGGEPKPEGDD